MTHSTTTLYHRPRIGIGYRQAGTGAQAGTKRAGVHGRCGRRPCTLRASMGGWAGPRDTDTAVALAAELLTRSEAGTTPVRAAAGRSPRPPPRRRRRPGAAVRPHRRGAAHARRRPRRCTSSASSSPAGSRRRSRRLDRVALRLAAVGARTAPTPVAAIVRRRIRAETRGVVIPAADPAFARHVAARTDGRLRPQRQPARRGDPRRRRGGGPPRRRVRPHPPPRRRLRLGEDLGPLRQPRRAGVRPRGRRASPTACGRSTTPRRAQSPPVFVNLDMEEYRDLHLTVAAFRPVLDEPAYRDLPAGIVAAGLPARLPRRLDDLVDVGRRRHASRRRAGQGAPRQGRQPGDGARRRRARRLDAGAVRRPRPRSTPATRRLLDRLLDAAAAGGLRGRRRQPQPVRRGVGARTRSAGAARPRSPRSRCSRAWPRRRRGRRASEAGRLLLYTPVVTDADFAASIAYLVPPARRERRARRTSCARCSRSRPARRRGTTERERFEHAGRRARTSVSTTPRRARTAAPRHRTFDPDAPFANEPDTDFTQPPTASGSPRHLARRPPGAAARRWSTTTGRHRRASSSGRRRRRRRAGAATSTAERRRGAAPAGRR